MNIRLFVIHHILLVFLFCIISTECGVLDPTTITNASISFENPQLVIALQFDRVVPGASFNLGGIILSNSPLFNPGCTFFNLDFVILGNATSSDLQNLTLSLDNSTAVITERSTGGMVCLESADSSWLQLPESLIPGIPLTSTLVSLRVIENTTPPSISNVIVDLFLGNISIIFDEFVDLDTLNPSLLSLSSSDVPNPSSSVAFTTLTNYNVATGVNTVYVIILEVFELALIGDVCVSNCLLHIGIGTLVSDFSGNLLIIQSQAIQPTTFDGYSPYQYIPSISTQIINPTRANVTINPSSTTLGVLNYGLYVFPLNANFYHGNCQYPLAYEFQKTSTRTRWDSLSLDYPPCINGTDYMCYSTSELNILIDLFPGYSMRIGLVTFYTNINFTSPYNDLSPESIYTDSLNVQVLTEPNRRRRLVTETPVGNQVYVTWQVEASFCEQHELTLYYKSQSNDYFSYINLDSVTTCQEKSVLLYATSGSFTVLPAIRTNASQFDVPTDSCIFVNLMSIDMFGIPQSRVDRPAISDVYQMSDGISINWMEFSPLSGLIIDYFNIYVFPVYALRFNGGSCSNIDLNTVASNFTFLPTEYYKYGISVPSDDFPFTCPPRAPPTGLSLPYTCNSVLSGVTSVFTPIDYSYAISIIVEAVIRDEFQNTLQTVRSYPFNYTSYTVDLGRKEVGYQQFTWDAQLCQSQNSFLFFHLSYLIFLDKTSSEEVVYSQVFQCSPAMGVDYLVPVTIPYYTSYSNYFSEVTTIDGDYCLLSYESLPTSVDTASFEGPFVGLFDFQYLDYETILVTFQIIGDIFYPINIYTIPTNIRSTKLFDEFTATCPAVSSPPLRFYLDFNSNSTLDNMNFLDCINTTDYTCTSVNSIINIPLRIIPGYEFNIRVANPNTQTFSPMFNGPFYPPFDFTILRFQRLQYTNTSLFPPNSIMVEWDTGFYCHPDSYINLDWEPSGFKPETRRRRGVAVITPRITLPCSDGSYVITDLGYETTYAIYGYVFFNATTQSFPEACPTLRILFTDIQTSPLLTSIRILDFSNIQVAWNALSFIDSPYTLVAYPSAYGSFDEPISVAVDPSIDTQTTNYLPSPTFNEDYFELCLNSSQAINCSMVTTFDTYANISVIPGYSYALALYVEDQNHSAFYFLGNRYDIREILQNEISVSGFDRIYTYFSNTPFCTSGVTTVYYYEALQSFGIDMFPVVMCSNDFTVFLNSDYFFMLPQPRMIFLFPFTNITYPSTNVTAPPAFGIRVDPPFSFLPISASPIITSVVPPVDLNSNIYQVIWSIPDIPIPQQFVSFTVFAYPDSEYLSQESMACPTNLTGFPKYYPIYSKSSAPLDDDCPATMSIGEFYFCGEITSTSIQIPLLTLLNYQIGVVATYSGGLKTFSSSYSSFIANSQDISSLSLAHQVTPASITITWNTQPSFCSDARLFFILNSSYIPDYVPCTSGSYTIDSLQPLITYTLAYEFFFELSASLLPEIVSCIANSPVNIEPFPETTSFCTPINPCSSVGVCSEGFQNSSFHCDCDIGYTFDGYTCVDINECSVMPNICGNGSCLNNMGSFTCTCFQGYFAISDIICFDINECGTPSNCVNGICTNLISPENYRCDCTAEFEGFSCTIPVGTPTCPSISELTTLSSTNNVTFPVTEYGVVSIVLCSQLNTTLFGNITRQCLDTGEWGPIDLGNCLRNIFVAAEVLTSESEIRILTPEESVMLTETLATATQESMGFLFPAEISIAAVGVGAVTESLADLSGDELSDNLDIVQASLVEITSNVLRTENSAAFASTTPSEAQTNINNLVDGIQNLAILIARVAEENTTLVLEILEPNVALILAVERGRTESLVLGSNLTMPVGNNTSAVMAAQTSITIPASIFPSNESIAVSVALFPTIQELASDVFVNDSSEPEGNLEDLLVTAIASINLIRTDGTPITELENDISIAFVINSPEFQESGIVSEIRCASTRVLSEGWNFNYVSLINGDDVPSLPAICNASHLTHFGVLVSVTSIPLTPTALLALEILTYLTCGISIIFLLLSIAAYLLLWWKTRKQQENLFQKDATILHLNFAVALLLALTFFLLSDAAYSNEGACKAFTIIQYYFWLSVFTSSLSIGIYLLIKIFAWSSQRRFWFYLVLLSWALPLPLIIIAPAAARDSLINTSEEVCFFGQAPSYSNLAFIVPMLVITITNLVILIITAIVLFRISKGNKSMLLQIRGVLIASFILAPILGLPWLFSIVATGTSVLVFIVTIFLGLQGTFFALLYPLRTPEILNYVMRCRDPYASTKLSQSSSSHPSHPAPTAIKFRVNRGTHGTTGTASTSLASSKHPGYELGEIKDPDAPRIDKVDNEGDVHAQYDHSATQLLKKTSD